MLVVRKPSVVAELDGRYPASSRHTTYQDMMPAIYHEADM